MLRADGDDVCGMFCSEMNPQDPPEHRAEKKRTAPQTQSPKKKPRAAGAASQQVADGDPAAEKALKRRSRAGVGTRPGGHKKCAKCKKDLAMDDFNADQAACKECCKIHRNLRQLAMRNSELTWFDNLNEADKNGLVKAYTKEKKDAERESKKTNFSIKNFKEELAATEGTRVEGQHKLMWYGEYKEWAQTAPAGFLSIEDIDLNWAAWKSDPKLTPQFDNKGPRGTLRIPVLTGDYINDFNEVALRRSLEQEQRLNKNISQAADLQKTIFQKYDADLQKL